MPNIPDERTRRLRKAALEGRLRIELADTTEVSALEPFVDRVLAAIAEVTEEPSITEALVTDLSLVSDLMCAFASLEEREAWASSAAKVLGVAVAHRDFVYEVARRLAGTSAAT